MVIDMTVQIWKEGRQYVAQALPLDIVSSGPTPDDARAAVTEAVQAFVLTAQDQGVLREVLEECGYREENGRWMAPEWVALERRAVSL